MESRVQGNLHARLGPGEKGEIASNPYLSAYDEAASEGERGERKEHRFLADTIHYLQTGGVLVYIIPQVRLGPEIARLLSYRFERLAAFLARLVVCR